MKRARRKTHHKTRSRADYVAALHWNIQDASEALHHAVGLENWAAVRKYTAQLETLQRKLFLAEAGPRSSKRTRRREFHYGHSAGATFGRGRLP